MAIWARARPACGEVLGAREGWVGSSTRTHKAPTTSSSSSLPNIFVARWFALAPVCAARVVFAVGAVARLGGVVRLSSLS